MKKLYYLLVVGILATSFNACSKSQAQEPDSSDLIVNATTSGRYIIVSGTTFSQLQTAVNSRLPLYKPAGGPFIFHKGGTGTENYGQALYK